MAWLVQLTTRLKLNNCQKVNLFIHINSQVINLMVILLELFGCKGE